MNMREILEERKQPAVTKKDVDNEFRALKRKLYDLIETMGLSQEQQKGAKSLAKDSADQCWHKMLLYLGIEKEGEYRAKQQSSGPSRRDEGRVRSD